jgi:hypothetical protein
LQEKTQAFETTSEEHTKSQGRRVIFFDAISQIPEEIIIKNDETLLDMEGNSLICLSLNIEQTDITD